MAFLLAFDGNLRDAVRHYRQAIAQQVDDDLIGKIEDFVVYVATTHPEKYQLYYCLGFFNRHFKGDGLQAAKDFNTFLQNRKLNEFAREAKLAEKWLRELPRIE